MKSIHVYGLNIGEKNLTFHGKFGYIISRKRPFFNVQTSFGLHFFLKFCDFCKLVLSREEDYGFDNGIGILTDSVRYKRSFIGNTV